MYMYIQFAPNVLETNRRSNRDPCLVPAQFSIRNDESTLPHLFYRYFCLFDLDFPLYHLVYLDFLRVKSTVCFSVFASDIFEVRQVAMAEINANFKFKTHSFTTLRNSGALARLSAGSRSLN